jgi:hypothetical protein
MHTRADIGETRERTGLLPVGVRRGLLAALAAVFAAALYLIAVRGEALLVDLSAVGRFFCL